MTGPRRAIVMGGSMAGLLAARTLADHVDEVLLVERDRLPDDAGHRKGVPQARHTHVLLGAGRLQLERLFPGLTDEIVARGAVLGDALGEVRRYVGGGCHRAGPSSLRTLYTSRPLLEACVRNRLRAMPGVRFLERHAVRGLVMSADGREVRGIAVEHDGTGATLEASLVVDATGRGSHTPQWLAQAGFPAPDEEVVECGLGYATRHFRHRDGLLGELKGVIVAPRPGSLRGAVLARQEGERWILTLVGLKGDRPEAGEDAFAVFARALGAPEIAEVVDRAEPIDEPVTATFPGNVRRRYDRLERFPERYLVVGDAICSFNPMYGQGMSVAALECRALAETLAEGGDEAIGPRFFRRAAPVLDAPWMLAAGNDLRLTKPDARVSRATRIVRWYMDRLHVAARSDLAVATAFLLVAGLVNPPASLFKPKVVLRVLAAGA